MGAAKRRREANPNGYGNPLLYECIFFDPATAKDGAFSVAIEVRRMGSHIDQARACLAASERLQWCLTWRDTETCRWRMANDAPGTQLATAQWVAEKLNRKLDKVERQHEWAPELAQREAAKLGFAPTSWRYLIENIEESLDPDVWCWELWPPDGGDGFFDGCLYRGIQGKDENASRLLRQHVEMAQRVPCTV